MEPATHARALTRNHTSNHPQGDTHPAGPDTGYTFTPLGAGFRGWKEVTSLFNDDDEEHLLGRCKSPKSRGTSLRLKEELKTEKKSGFWDNLVLKPNTQSKKPDEIEGWEPPKLALEDVAAESLAKLPLESLSWSLKQGEPVGTPAAPRQEL
ncbi:hypothetical protein D623_10002989 [Myotis brandtii]|uniref:Testis development-related protein n=1 Tax=Myotis brandtii TaxID=109478 RepID=S7NN83_MYOBR|nr:hypothetical protein D623_10002989 [Myotis brandtii]